MVTPFDTVAFLASSENRVRLLEATAEEPRTRADLHGETGIAKATLGRILSDLQERGWVRRDGPRYEATPRGRYLIREVESLLGTVAALDELGDLVQWFPVEDVPFGLDRLRDARVTRPSKQHALEPITRSLELIEDASHFRAVAAQHAPPVLEVMWEATIDEQRQTVELVLTDAVIDTVLADETDAERFRDLVESDRADVFRTPARWDYNCVAPDDRVLFALSDEQGAPQALVETDDPVVREWFDAFFRTAREEATRLITADLPD